MKPIHVQRKVGMNPVAQAVFRARLAGWALDTKIKALMLGQNEPCKELLEDGGYILTIIDEGALLERLNTPELRIMRGGLSAIMQMRATNLWDIHQAQAVVQALVQCEVVIKQLKAASINKAVRSTAHSKD